MDEERFPSSVEVDENQEQLFPIEAETADRVTLGKVRDDVDVTIGDVEVRAKRTEERIAGRDLRNDWDTDRSADAEEERRRAGRETKQERQQLRELANQQARNAEPEPHI